MPLLYHYTDEAGMKGIYSKGMIEASGSNNLAGLGVYFTEMKPPPVNTAEVISINNYGTSWNVDKVLKWFKFQLHELPTGTVKLTNIGDRNVWMCPVNVPIKRKGRQANTRSLTVAAPRRRVLYHYTNERGKNGILASGVIKAVRPHGGQGIGATMPVAVYFTGLPPSAVKEDLLFNMYGTRDTSKQDLADKMKFWFKFYEEDIPNVEKRSTLQNRNEWICRQDVPINLSTCPGNKPRASNSNYLRHLPAGTGHGSGGQRGGTSTPYVHPPRASNSNYPQHLPSASARGSGVGGQRDNCNIL